MIYDNMEFHNTVELLDYAGGKQPVRFPKEVRDTTNLPHGRMSTRIANACEIRFICDAKYIHATFTAHESDAIIAAYIGDYLLSETVIEANSMKTIRLEPPNWFPPKTSLWQEKSRFPLNMWRLVICGHIVCFNDIETFGFERRVPTKEELPSKKYLAYGSSITQALGVHNSYVDTTAKILGMDSFNLGMGGSCRMEKEVSDFIINRDDWTLLTMELGVNCRMVLSVEEFEKRAKYLIDNVSAKHKLKPIFVITSYPNSNTFKQNGEYTPVGVDEHAFNDILRKIVQTLNRDNLTLIEGSDILTDITYLSADLIHPTAYGQAFMGQNLAKILEDFI